MNNMGIGRALIIAKPWIDRILDNGKIWEMRSTKTSVRGKIGLIEAGSGLIVGEAVITGCANKPLTPFERIVTSKYHQVHDLDLLEKWCYAWFLADAKRYDEPVKYKHPRGAVIWVKL